MIYIQAGNGVNKLQPNQPIGSNEQLEFVKEGIKGAPEFLQSWLWLLVIIVAVGLVIFVTVRIYNLKSEKKAINEKDNKIQNLQDQINECNIKTAAVIVANNSLEKKVKELETLIHKQNNQLQTAELERIELAGLKDRKIEFEAQAQELQKLRDYKSNMDSLISSMQEEVIELRSNIQVLQVEKLKFAERAYIAETKFEMMDKFINNKG